jgi:hypothetical protein
LRKTVLEQQEVVVEHDDAKRVAVPPEVLVILFDGSPTSRRR